MSIVINPLIFLYFLGIWSFDPAVCRSMGVAYTNVQTNYNDIPVYVYELDLSDDLNAKKCFCRDENTCPPKGTFDMYRCSGVRINSKKFINWIKISLIFWIFLDLINLDANASFFTAFLQSWTTFGGHRIWPSYVRNPQNYHFIAINE